MQKRRRNKGLLVVISHLSEVDLNGDEMKVKCNSCGKLFTEDTIMIHAFGECKIPKSKKKREMYWKNLIQKELWNYLDKVKEGTASIQFGEATLTEVRSGLILYSLGFITLEAANKAGLTPDTVSYMIAAAAPEAILYMMEFAEVVEIDEETGIVKLTEEGKKMHNDQNFYIR